MSSPSSTPAQSPYEFLLLGCSGSGKTLFTRHIKYLCDLNQQEHGFISAEEVIEPVLHTTEPTTGFSRVDLKYTYQPTSSSATKSMGASLAGAAAAPTSASASATSSSSSSFSSSSSTSSASAFGAQTSSFVIKELGGEMRSTWAHYFSKAQAVLFMVDRSDVCSLSSCLFELMTLLTHVDLVHKPILVLLNKSDEVGSLSLSELQLVLSLDDLVKARHLQTQQQQQQQQQQQLATQTQADREMVQQQQQQQQPQPQKAETPAAQSTTTATTTTTTTTTAAEKAGPGLGGGGVMRLFELNCSPLVSGLEAVLQAMLTLTFTHQLTGK